MTLHYLFHLTDCQKFHYQRFLHEWSITDVQLILGICASPNSLFTVVTRQHRTHHYSQLANEKCTAPWQGTFQYEGKLELVQGWLTWGSTLHERQTLGVVLILETAFGTLTDGGVGDPGLPEGCLKLLGLWDVVREILFLHGRQHTGDVTGKNLRGGGGYKAIYPILEVSSLAQHLIASFVSWALDNSKWVMSIFTPKKVEDSTRHHW